MDQIAGLQLNAPLGLLFLLAVLPAVVMEFYRRGRSGAIPMSSLSRFGGDLARTSLRRKLVRAGLLCLVAVLLAAALGGPSLRSSAPLLASGGLATQKNVILAIDVSRSMSSPLEVPDRETRLANFGRAPGDAEPGRSRYEAARETVYRFIERFPTARIGLILFSTEPFLARWPTVETDGMFLEVLDENLDELSQLRRFSSLTNTDAALRLAGSVFEKLETRRGGAVIHISDAEDELENMGAAIRELREQGIRLYTFGVGISGTVVDKLAEDFGGDPGFRIFRVDSEEEMQEAYRLVAELEESPRYTQTENTYVTDLRWLFAICTVLVAVPVLWLLEIRLARSQLAFPVARREG